MIAVRSSAGMVTFNPVINNWDKRLQPIFLVAILQQLDKQLNKNGFNVFSFTCDVIRDLMSLHHKSKDLVDLINLLNNPQGETFVNLHDENTNSLQFRDWNGNLIVFLEFSYKDIKKTNTINNLKW